MADQPTSPATPPRLLRVRGLLAEQPQMAAVLIAASLVSGFLQAAILAMIAEAAAAMVQGHDTVSATLGPVSYHGSLRSLLLAAVVAAIAQLGVQVVMAYVPSVILVEAQRGIRERLFRAYTEASWRSQSRDTDGALQELMTYQTFMGSQAVLTVANIVVAVLSFAALVISALVIDWVVALTVMAATSVLFVALRPLSRLQSQQSRRLSAAQLEFATGVSEAARLSEEAQVFGTRHVLRQDSDARVDRMSTLLFRTTLLSRLIAGGYQGLVLLIVVAGLAVVDVAHTGQFASLGALVLMLVRASMYGQQAQAGIQRLHQALPYLDKVEERIQAYAAAPAVDGEVSLDSISAVSLVGVRFGYDDRAPALAGIDVEIEQGAVVGIVGPSGAGKSTLVRLLLRLYPPDSGQYLVDALPAAAYSRDSWNARVAYLPQEPRLLHGSVRDNIRFFRDIDDASCERAARLAHVHHDIADLPQGYDNVTGPGGAALSIGQAQRVCLARALAGNPDLLLLDEPTSALDPVSEALIQRTIDELRGAMTVVLVAHRLSLLAVCDLVLVLVDGKLEAAGPPATVGRQSTYLRAADSAHGAA